LPKIGFLGLLILVALLMPSLARMETTGFSISGEIIPHNKKGNLLIEVVNEAEFNGKTVSIYQKEYATGTGKKKEVPFKFDGIPKRIYAIRCFQDVNGNKQLDRDMFRRPTEPWGMYRQSDPSKLAGFHMLTH
jgi:uncharacterized protein (DUF2141 family)